MNINASPTPPAEPEKPDAWGPGRGIAVAVGSVMGVLLLCSTIYFIRSKRDPLRGLLAGGGHVEGTTKAKMNLDSADSTLEKLSP